MAQQKEVKLPDIGEGVTEGELVKWLVKVGDSVEADQAVAEVMTDKATVEVPSPYKGVVAALKANEGDVIPVETTILLLEESAGSAKTAGANTSSTAITTSGSQPAMMAKSDSAIASTTSPQASKTSAIASTTSAVSAPNGSSYSGLETYSEVFPPAADIKVLATPSTRRLARELKVDLNQLEGSGLAGRVTREDVMQATQGSGALSAGSASMAPTAGAAQQAKASIRPSIPVPSYQSQPGAAEERVALRGIRKKIAENLQMAKQVIPHFTLMEEIKVSALSEVRQQAKEAGEKYGVKVTYLPFVMKALVATMREFPMFNASIDDQAQEIVYKKFFNIGFAADTPNGLVVPVVKNVDHKTTLQIAAEINELALKARDGKLALDEMRGATITITNIGSVGGTYATPIINHPEVAILGMYKLQHKPVWNGKEFVPEQVMNYTITCDHRLIDGAVAANFMKAFAGRIENPSRLFLDMI